MMQMMLDEFDDDVLDNMSLYSEEVAIIPAKPRPPPTLDDYIGAVLAEGETIELDGHKEKVYDTALGIAKRVLDFAFGIHPLFRKYLQLRAGKPYIVDFRAVDSGVFQCLIPIKRSVRPDTINVCYKKPCDFPNHRILVTMNESLTGPVDRLLISKEWGHCVDTNNVLRPDFILHWFNDGLMAAQDTLRQFRPRSAFGYSIVGMTFSYADDGTLFIYFTRKSRFFKTKIKVNMVPCMIITDIPRQLNINVPIPCRRPYGRMHTEFMSKVNEAMNAGEKIFFLEARMARWDKRSGYEPNIVCSWGLNLCAFEERALQYVSSLPSGKHFKDVMMMMNQIKHSHIFCLHVVTKRVLLHIMLYEHRQNMDKLCGRHDCFMSILGRLLDHLGDGSLPSFFQNKLDLLGEHHSNVLKFTYHELERMIIKIKENPQYLVICAGYEIPPGPGEVHVEEVEESIIDSILCESEEEDDDDEDDYTKMAEDESSRVLDDLTSEDSNNTDTCSEESRKLRQKRSASIYSGKIDHDESKLSLLRGHEDSSSLESWEESRLNESTVTKEAKDETTSSRELRRSADILSEKSDSSAGVFDTSEEEDSFNFERVFTTESSQPAARPKVKVLTKKRPKYYGDSDTSSA